MIGQNEFSEFLEGGSESPPAEIQRSLFERVHRDLHPRISQILLKIGLIHIVFGTLTLVFCPQFGVSFVPGAGLFAFFMKFGHEVCMAACGVTFIGGTALVSSWTLSVEELRRLRTQWLWPWVSLSLVSLGVLHLFGASVLEFYTMIWLMAAGLAGTGIFEAGWRIRLLCQNQRPI